MALAGAGAGLLRALALGDRRGLSPAQRDAFARLGIAHILAVSGLHLALVASLFFAATRWTVGRSAALAARRDTRVFALAAGVAAAVIYAVLSGWGVPVRRALVLLFGLALAVASGRPRALLPPLAAAAIAVLAFEPQALFLAGRAALLRRQSRARAGWPPFGHGTGVGSRLRDAARVGRAARFGERRDGDGAAGRDPPRPGGALRPGRESGRDSVDGLRPAPGRRSRPGRRRSAARTDLGRDPRVGRRSRPRDRDRGRVAGVAAAGAGGRGATRMSRVGRRRCARGVLLRSRADTHARAPRARGDGRRRARAAARVRARAAAARLPRGGAGRRHAGPEP